MRRDIRRVVLGVVAAVAISGEALPQTGDGFFSGNKLYDYCTNPDAVQICASYITGIADALAARASIRGWRACFPPNVTVGQIRDVAVEWLRKNPQKRHVLAADLVAQATARAFPCR